MSILLVAIYILLTAVCLTGLLRNELISSYRTRLTKAVHRKNMNDIDSNNYKSGKLDQRWNELRRVSYNKMVWVFWRKPSSFYDQEFLKEVGMK